MLRSIAAHRERRRLHSPRALRCVSKHEATPIARPHPSRRAYAPASLRNLFGMRAPEDEDERRVLHSSPYKQPPSFPRRVSAPGVLHLGFTHPESRGGRSAERRSGACEAPVGPAHDAAGQALARRLASHDAGRSPLGAPPWRFWAPGAALLSPAFAPDRLQRAPRSQVVVPGGRLPEPPGASGYGAATAGRHASLRIQDRL